MLSPAMRALTDTMFLSLFFSLPAMLAIWMGFCVETDPMFKRVMTQRKRYAFVAFGQLGVIATLLWVLNTVNWSFSTMQQGIETSWAYSAFGKVLAFGFVMTVLSPLMSIWALATTVTEPSYTHRKVFRKEIYYTTKGNEAVVPTAAIVLGKAERAFAPYIPEAA